MWPVCGVFHLTARITLCITLKTNILKSTSKVFADLPFMNEADFTMHMQ